MPELQFKGKEFVYNHHLSVPFRPLLPDPKKSIGEPSLSGNLIIHGDNLHALKALLPIYTGKVDCVFIDPPYNTGNEGWSYNDNVSSPMMKEWLSSNPINGEDMLRHDKWAAMMWPRLVLLKELMSDTASIWITIDDNEVQNARLILDEIFGASNFIATCIWHKADSPKNTAEHFSVDHDYILVYARNAKIWRPNLRPRSKKMLARYKNPDNDPRGKWLLSDLAARNYYAHGTYPITTPKGRVIEGPPPGSYWRVRESKFEKLKLENRIWWGDGEDNRPGIKRFLTDVKKGIVPQTIWDWREVGSTRNSKQALSRIVGNIEGQDLFITPKPVKLIERILALASNSKSLVLDSFAGSGTTGHAVLAANKKDDGSRRFILVESEKYANSLTAERIRRASKGYSFTGMHREQLFKESLNWGKLGRIDAILSKVQKIEQAEAARFDTISKTVKAGDIIVTGEKRVEKRADGLGGDFTYCTLGEPLNLDSMLTGENLPDYLTLGSWLFHTATGGVFSPDLANEEGKFLGEGSAYYCWLVYKPDLAYLKSPEAALTLSLAESIAASKPKGKKHLVFAPAKYVPNSKLLPMGVEYAPLPFALYRIEKG